MMKTADGGVKPCCLLAQGIADGQTDSVAVLFQAVTPLLTRVDSRCIMWASSELGCNPDCPIETPNTTLTFGIEAA